MQCTLPVITIVASIATREFGQTMYGYTLMVPKNQGVLNKLSKERNTNWSEVIHDTRSAKISLTQDERNTCNHAMCPPGYYHSGPIATRQLGQTIYGYTLMIPKNEKRVLNKLSKERNTSGQKWFMIHRVLKSHWRKMSVIHVIMQCALPVITIVAL